MAGRGPKERQERVQHLHRDVDQENHRRASQKDQGRVEQRLKGTQHPQEREEPQGLAGISLDATATGALRRRSLDQLDVIEIRTALEALSSRHFLINTAVMNMEQVNYVEVLLMIDLTQGILPEIRRKNGKKGAQATLMGDKIAP